MKRGQVLTTLLFTALLGADSSDQLNALAAARQAIENADYDGALSSTRTLTQAVLTKLQEMPPSSEVVQPLLYSATPGNNQSLLVIADRVKDALDLNDLIRARDYSVTLNAALTQARSEHAPAPSQKLAQLEESVLGMSVFQRFLLLPRLSKAAFANGDFNKATGYAMEMLAQAQAHQGKWPQGQALVFGNVVLGQVSMAQGNRATAGMRLLAAAKTPGSPVLNSFGPNMSLARDLLKAGQGQVVVEYLTACKKFWKLENGRLSKWTAMIQQGSIPDFGPNLLY